eukprot:764012-Hanusia_phi.AAC.2
MAESSGFILIITIIIVLSSSSYLVHLHCLNFLILPIRFVVWSFLDLQIKISTQTRLYTIVDKVESPKSLVSSSEASFSPSPSPSPSPSQQQQRNIFPQQDYHSHHPATSAAPFSSSHISPPLAHQDLLAHATDQSSAWREHSRHHPIQGLGDKARTGWARVCKEGEPEGEKRREREERKNREQEEIARGRGEVLEDKGLGAGRLGDVRRGIPRSERLQARVKLAGGKKEEKDDVGSAGQYKLRRVGGESGGGLMGSKLARPCRACEVRLFEEIEKFIR